VLCLIAAHTLDGFFVGIFMKELIDFDHSITKHFYGEYGHIERARQMEITPTESNGQIFVFLWPRKESLGGIREWRTKRETYSDSGRCCSSNCRRAAAFGPPGLKARRLHSARFARRHGARMRVGRSVRDVSRNWAGVAPRHSNRMRGASLLGG
jgi:hypothetical protein